MDPEIAFPFQEPQRGRIFKNGHLVVPERQPVQDVDAGPFHMSG